MPIGLDLIHNADDTFTVIATDRSVGAIYSYGPLDAKAAADVLTFYGMVNVERMGD